MSQRPSQQTEGEIRFAHLLNPIKDLTKNWEVDIAKYLEEYLSELEDVQFSFDDGETTMNFAEAALLIQGSACIYCRKVEFLWQMVLSMLDVVTKKRKAKDKGDDNGGEGAGDAIEDNDDFDFLDKDLKIGKNTMLKKNDKSSCGFKYMIPTPQSLIEKGSERNTHGVPVYDKAQDLIGYQDDFVVNLHVYSATGEINLKLNCELLNGQSYTSTQPQISSQQVQPEFSVHSPPGSPPAMEDDVYMEAPPSPSTHDDPTTPTETRDKCVRLGGPDRIVNAPPKPKKDMWKLHDLHESTPEDKPFNKSNKCKKVPKNIKQFKAQRSRKRLEMQDPGCTIAEFISKEMSCMSSILPSNPLKQPMKEFMSEALDEHKHRANILRQRKVKNPLAEDMIAAAADDDEDDELGMNNDGLGGGDDFAGGNFEDDDIVENDGDLFDDVGRDGDYGGAGDGVITSYEHLVQQRVAEYVSAAQNYIESSELAKKVKDWERMVLPRLHILEKKKDFNFMEYGDSLLGQFSDVGATYDFYQICSSEPTEVSRVFLATLMMANTYNVEIQPPADPSVVNDFRVKLLSTKKRYEELEEYEAPSVASSRSPTKNTQAGADKEVDSQPTQPKKKKVRKNRV